MNFAVNKVFFYFLLSARGQRTFSSVAARGQRTVFPSVAARGQRTVFPSVAARGQWVAALDGAAEVFKMSSLEQRLSRIEEKLKQENKEARKRIDLTIDMSPQRSRPRPSECVREWTSDWAPRRSNETHSTWYKQTNRSNPDTSLTLTLVVLC